MQQDNYKGININVSPTITNSPTFIQNNSKMNIDYNKPSEVTNFDKTDEESVFNGSLIRTVSGLYVNIFDPKPEMFSIDDIAHGLANTCRWGGQCRDFYSVAQHSIRVAIRLPLEFRFAGLLHDASEAFMLDMPRPIKRQLARYKELESGVMSVIAAKFGFAYPMLPEIKVADNEELDHEHQDLMLKSNTIQRITCWSPQRAKEQFLELYHEVKPLTF